MGCGAGSDGGVGSPVVASAAGEDTGAGGPAGQDCEM